MLDMDRMITTDMSANIVNNLLKVKWSHARIARTIGATVDFVRGVQSKLHILMWKDIEALAERAEQTPHLMLLGSMKNIRPELQPLFDSTQRVLEASATFRASLVRKSPKRRRPRTKAA